MQTHFIMSHSIWFLDKPPMDRKHIKSRQLRGEIQQWISTVSARGALVPVPAVRQVPAQSTAILLPLLISFSQTPQKYLRDLLVLVTGKMKTSNGRFPCFICTRWQGWAHKEYQWLLQICSVCINYFIYLTCLPMFGWRKLLIGYAILSNAPSGAVTKRNTDPIHFNTRTHFNTREVLKAKDITLQQKQSCLKASYFQLFRSVERGRRCCQPHHTLSSVICIPLCHFISPDDCWLFKCN